NGQATAAETSDGWINAVFHTFVFDLVNRAKEGRCGLSGSLCLVLFFKETSIGWCLAREQASLPLDLQIFDLDGGFLELLEATSFQDLEVGTQDDIIFIN
ncbi:hypothetical protein ACJX0J_010127, partial [Zea mays]